MALAFTGLGDRDTTVEAMMRDRRRAQLGRVPRRAAARIRRRRRTSSTPTSPATSASSAPASCRCANRATGSRRPTARPALTTGSATIPFEQLPQLHNPDDRLRLQRQQRQRARRSPADLRARLGREVPRAAHPAILRHDRQAQPRHVGGDAGRPAVARRQGVAALPQGRRAERRARPSGAGAAGGLGRRDGQGSPRAADLHGFHEIVAPYPDGGKDRHADGGARSVRGDDADRAAARPSRLVRRARQARSRTAARRWRARSTRRWRCSSSATAPT